MKCKKCGEEMEYVKTRTSESWICLNCHHGVIKPRLWIGRLWNILYGLKHFFMNPAECIVPIKERKRKKRLSGNE
jgi:hypothetical protein